MATTRINALIHARKHSASHRIVTRTMARSPLARAPVNVALEFNATTEQIACVLAGCLGALFLQHASLFYLKRYHRQFIDGLDAKSRADVGIRCASSVWGMMCGVWAATLLPRALETSTDTLTRMYAQPPLVGAERLMALATGFFAWDTVVSKMYYEAQYFWHGLVSVVVFGLPMFMPRGFLHLYACNFLMWETTIPCMSARNILIKAGMGSTTMFKAVELVGFAFLIIIRFVIGLPMMYLYFKDASAMFAAKRASPTWVYVWYVTASVVLQVMNFIWLAAILRAVFGKGKKKRDEGAMKEE